MKIGWRLENGFEKFVKMQYETEQTEQVEMSVWDVILQDVAKWCKNEG